MLSQHFCFSFSPKSYLYPSHALLYTFSLKYNYDNFPRKCVLYYDSTVECHTQEYTLFSAIAYSVLVIFIICPTHFVPHKTKVCLMLWISQVACSTHVCGIISGTARMEPLVLVTLGSFLHRSSSSEYCYCSCS